MTILINGVLLFIREPVSTGNVAAGLAGVIAGALLVVGFCTTLGVVFVSVLCACALFSLLPGSYLFDSGLATFLAAAMGVSIALLGPGALSADARLFGPREIVISAARQHGNATTRDVTRG